MALKEVEPKNIYVWINVPDYTVQRKNRDSTVLETDLNVMEGTTPTYNGATPTRSGYDFTGWNPTPAPIYANTDYTAQFEATVWDYLATQATGTITNVSYVFGVCITPNKNCSITKVKFLGDNASVGTLYINPGDRMQQSVSSTTFAITLTNSTGGEYTLETPYQLTANTDYCIGYLYGNSGSAYGSNNTITFPVSGTNIKFNYGTRTGTQSTYSYCYNISGLQTV